ncbi:MAG: glycosyltransferase family 39 protein, partial [Thermodesulfovibrionales bacterium]
MNILDLDREVFSLINSGISHPLIDSMMVFLTSRGYLLLIPFIAAILWSGYRGKMKGDGEPMRAALWAMAVAFLSFLLADWFGGEIKGLVRRVRPCNVIDGVRSLVGCSSSFSMPSNHAANYFAAGAALFFLLKGQVSGAWRVYPLILAGLVGLSRVYVGVHYPSDVLAGAVMGVIISFIMARALGVARARYRENPSVVALSVGVVAISIFRIYYILHGPLDLSADEAHYWEWSRRPDLSYYSKGPMIAWLIMLGTAIFGDTVFGVRILAVLLAALSSLFLFLLVRAVYPGREGERAAAFAALLLQALPLFAPFGVIFSIDAPFIFFWVLSLYLFWRAVSEGAGRDWLLLGLAVGMGLLTKYTMAFFLLCGLLFLIAARRDLLRTAMPWLSGLVSLVCFSPVIIWNLRNDWVTVKHTAGQAHVADGLTISLMSFLEFLGSQAGAVTPVIFVMIFIALFRLLKKERGERSLFLFCFSVPVIAFFLLKSIQGKVQANWAMTGYITGIIAFCHLYLSGFGRMRPGLKGLTIFGIVSALILTALSFYPALVNLPARMDLTAKLRGWKELGREVSSLAGEVSQPGELLIFS